VRHRSSALVLFAALAGCTSARVTATIEGEPVCYDFELGSARTQFKGALRKPVKITVLSGKTQISERVDLGKRSPSDKPGVLVVQDANETYTVRFAQCENEFAPQPVTGEKREPSERPGGTHTEDRTHYSCGDAKTYKEIEIKVRSGHPETRVVPWQAPPEGDCLASKVPAAEKTTGKPTDAPK
jgi:hypothetical protein